MDRERFLSLKFIRLLRVVFSDEIKASVFFVVRKKFRAMFSKEFYQKNPVAGTYSSLVSMLICLLGRVLH